MSTDKGIIRILFISWCFFASIIYGCASYGSEEDRPLDADYFESHDQCVTEWSDIFSEWDPEEGGSFRSISDIRESILKNKNTRLAKIVKSVRDSQDDVSYEEFGSWPIDSKSYRDLNDVFHFVSKSYVSDQCANFAWFAPFVWDGVNQGVGEGATGVELESFPNELVLEPRKKNRWLTYWLLLKTKE